MAKGIKPAPKKRKHQRLSEHARLVEERARSIPPGVVHDLFDTSALPVPPPAPLRHPGPGRRFVSKPPPHPPRPSHLLNEPQAAALEEVEEEVELEEVDGHEESQTDGFGSHTISPHVGLEHRSVAAGRSQRSRVLPAVLGVTCILALALATGWQVKRSGRVASRAESKPTPESAAIVSERPRVPASPPPVAEDLPLLPPGVAAAPSASATPSEPESTKATTVPAEATRSTVVSVSPDTAAVAASNPVLAQSRFTPSASSGASHEAPGQTGTFDAAVAEAAIDSAFGRAKSCRTPGAPKGIATVTLTYAPSGRVTTALVSGVFAGTSVGSCIAAALRSARIQPYTGTLVTVKRSAKLD
jgi:hypothetical protein